jgi:hypothetical protein
MPKTIKDLRNVTGLIVCDGLDTVMRSVNQQARQIQSAIIEGQSAGAGATLAFGEDSKAIRNLCSLRATVDAKLDALISEIKGAKEMSVDADQLEMAGQDKAYALPPAIPMGDQ